MCMTFFSVVSIHHLQLCTLGHMGRPEEFYKHYKKYMTFTWRSSIFMSCQIHPENHEYSAFYNIFQITVATAISPPMPVPSPDEGGLHADWMPHHVERNHTIETSTTATSAIALAFALSRMKRTNKRTNKVQCSFKHTTSLFYPHLCDSTETIPGSQQHALVCAYKQSNQAAEQLW